MVNQYVGARYVPKFADPVAWASGTSYEAMTIVTYNNSSYTSKIPVPAMVGNPADNPDYWALTGNYNAQVEQYRQEVAKAAEDAATATQAVNLSPGENTVTVHNIPAFENYQRGFIELTLGSANNMIQNPYYIKTGVIYLARQNSTTAFTNWTDTEVPLSDVVVNESASTVTFKITLPEGQYGQMIMKVYI